MSDVVTRRRSAGAAKQGQSVPVLVEGKSSSQPRPRQTRSFYRANLPKPWDGLESWEERAKFKPGMRGWLHILGTFGFLYLGYGLVFDAAAPQKLYRNADSMPAWSLERLGLMVYVFCVWFLFAVSAVLHTPTWSPRMRHLIGQVDHCAIYFVISGSYTPIVLMLSGLTRWILVCVWGGAFLGTIMTFTNARHHKYLTVVPYFLCGWSCLIATPSVFYFVDAMSIWGAGLVLLGGLCYSFGGLAYALHYPDPWPAWFGYHEIFHMGTVVGAYLVYLAVRYFVLAAFIRENAT